MFNSRFDDFHKFLSVFPPDPPKVRWHLWIQQLAQNPTLDGWSSVKTLIAGTPESPDLLVSARLELWGEDLKKWLIKNPLFAMTKTSLNICLWWIWMNPLSKTSLDVGGPTLLGKYVHILEVQRISKLNSLYC